MMDWNEFNKYCAALTAWREARGEVATVGRDALRGVLHVIANRAKLHNKSWAQIVFQFEQFSSMTAPNDPQIKAGIVPTSPDTIFIDCYAIADAIMGGSDADLTLGSTNYFNPHMVLPSWAADMTATVVIGNHAYYKEA